MKKKVIASILAASMAAMALTGCGGGKTTSEAQSATTDETTASAEAGSTADGAEAPDLNQDTKGTTITFWHSMGGVNGEAMDYLVNKFNEENTDGITVEAVYQGEYDDTINKLKSAQIGNMGADLVQIYDIGTRFMIDSGWVIPMQELIDADGYDISQIEPNIAAYYTVNNELYSMPFNSSTPILYYNKDMFEKAGITEVPTSLEGILAIGDDLKTKGGAGEPLALSIYGWYFEQWLCKQGLSYADNGNGRDAAATAVEFDSNGGALNILNEWKALNDADVAPNVGRAGSDTATTDFTSGKAAITLGSTASLKQILQDVNGSFEVGTAYFPTIKDGDEGGVSIGGASLWALNNNDDAKAAATWKFIKFLISPESQAYWNAETGYFPVTTAADEEQTFKDNVAQYPQFQTAIDQDFCRFFCGMHQTEGQVKIKAGGEHAVVCPDSKIIFLHQLARGNGDLSASRNHPRNDTDSGREYNRALGCHLPEFAGKYFIFQRQNKGKRDHVGGMCMVNNAVSFVLKFFYLQVHQMARKL